MKPKIKLRMAISGSAMDMYAYIPISILGQIRGLTFGAIKIGQVRSA